MTDWKPKTLTEVLSHEIGSAFNDNIKYMDLGGGNTGPEYLDTDDLDKIISEAIRNILYSKEIEIRFKGE